MKRADFYPLIAFVVPTVVTAYGFVIPHSCIAGWNAQSVGFAMTVAGASLTYWTGLSRMRRRMAVERGDAPT